MVMIGPMVMDRISDSEAMNLAKKGAEINWHDIYQTPYFYYWEDGKNMRSGLKIATAWPSNWIWSINII